MDDGPEADATVSSCCKADVGPVPGEVEPAVADAFRPWFLYLIRCNGGQIYTGVTTDVARRFREHSEGQRGARFLRGRGPLTLVFQTKVGQRGEALRAEYRVKRLRRAQKERLIEGQIEIQALLE